jgi:hypothetical protein
MAVRTDWVNVLMLEQRIIFRLVTGRTNAEAAARPVIFATADSELEGVNGQIFGFVS